MQKHRDIFGQIARVALASLACTAVMLAIYLLAGCFSKEVLFGSLAGVVLSLANFFALCIAVSNAVDRAARGESPQRAQLSIQTSSVLRPLVLVVIYILLFRTKLFDPVAALLPLLFTQVSIKVIEFFRKDEKDGGTAQ